MPISVRFGPEKNSPAMLLIKLNALRNRTEITKPRAGINPTNDYTSTPEIVRRLLETVSALSTRSCIITNDLLRKMDGNVRQRAGP